MYFRHYCIPCLKTEALHMIFIFFTRYELPGTQQLVPGVLSECFLKTYACITHFSNQTETLWQGTYLYFIDTFLLYSSCNRSMHVSFFYRAQSFSMSSYQLCYVLENANTILVYFPDRLCNIKEDSSDCRRAVTQTHSVISQPATDAALLVQPGAIYEPILLNRRTQPRNNAFMNMIIHMLGHRQKRKHTVLKINMPFPQKHLHLGSSLLL